MMLSMQVALLLLDVLHAAQGAHIRQEANHDNKIHDSQHVSVVDEHGDLRFETAAPTLTPGGYKRKVEREVGTFSDEEGVSIQCPGDDGKLKMQVDTPSSKSWINKEIKFAGGTLTSKCHASSLSRKDNYNEWIKDSTMVLENYPSWDHYECLSLDADGTSLKGFYWDRWRFLQVKYSFEGDEDCAGQAEQVQAQVDQAEESRPTDKCEFQYLGGEWGCGQLTSPSSYCLLSQPQDSFTIHGQAPLGVLCKAACERTAECLAYSYGQSTALDDFSNQCFLYASLDDLYGTSDWMEIWKLTTSSQRTKDIATNRNPSNCNHPQDYGHSKCHCQTKCWLQPDCEKEVPESPLPGPAWCQNAMPAGWGIWSSVTHGMSYTCDWWLSRPTPFVDSASKLGFTTFTRPDRPMSGCIQKKKDTCATTASCEFKMQPAGTPCSSAKRVGSAAHCHNAVSKLRSGGDYATLRYARQKDDSTHTPQGCYANSKKNKAFYNGATSGDNTWQWGHQICRC